MDLLSTQSTVIDEKNERTKKNQKKNNQHVYICAWAWEFLVWKIFLQLAVSESVKKKRESEKEKGESIGRYE